MSLSMKLVATSVAAAAVIASGCASETTDNGAAPSADETTLAGQQSISGPQGFTVAAQTPSYLGSTYTPYLGYWANVTGSVVISGGTGTFKMGVCLQYQRWNSAGTAKLPCSSVSECPAPVTSGGAMYCAAPQNSGQKYCWERVGGQTTSCAGSPANGGSPIGNGTYTTPVVNWPGGNTWISYGCVNGCTGSYPTPSVSSAVTY